MSGLNIDILMELWVAYSALQDPEDASSLDLSPISQHGDMYSKIDAIQIGSVPWQSITLSYNGPLPEIPPSWMKAGHTIWFRDPQLLFKKTQTFKTPLIMHHISNMMCMTSDGQG